MIKIRWRILSSALLVLCVFAGPAYADALNGTASGSFYNNAGTVNLGNPWNGLSYTGNTFNQPQLTNGTVNLGSFDVSTWWQNYDSISFRLSVGFSLPAGTIPNPLIGNADITGTVTFLGGTAFINFTNTPVPLTYSNANGSGSFSLAVSDVNVGNYTGPQILQGTISNAVFNPVPEPASVALLLSVLAGVGYALRKRISTTV